MWLSVVFVTLCCAIGTLCYNPPCDGSRSVNENVRIKRAKYYPSSPQRYHRRPPMSHQTHGAYSYTPPPNYMDDEETNQGPYKHGRKPSNDGLGEQDINNLIKYLSKKDLNKIVEYAVSKDKYKKGYYDRPLDYSNNNEDSSQDYYNGNRFSLNGQYGKKKTEYKNPITNYIPETGPTKFNDLGYTPAQFNYNNRIHRDETTHNQQFAVVDAYIDQMVGKEKDLNVFTDSSVMSEEMLPAPVNLRHEDYDAMFTNNVPAVVEADSSSYDVENFGDLPLMNYNSKLHSVSSYNVPHYTVTTPEMNQPSMDLSPPSSSSSSSTSASDENIPPLELAPMVTNYKEQSDAHLKAIKIWSHRSRGTAYTLHEDGTLSLEKPLQPMT